MRPWMPSGGAAPEGGRSAEVVVLLHGFPYDGHSYMEVVPLRVAAGHRVLVPCPRGHGPTRHDDGTADGNSRRRTGLPRSVASPGRACTTRWQVQGHHLPREAPAASAAAVLEAAALVRG